MRPDLKRSLPLLILLSSEAFGFVHISQKKPRLPVSPANPTVTFYWDGDSPTLNDKEEIYEKLDINPGNPATADISDQAMMAMLLTKAMETWNSVETSYLEFQLQTDPTVTGTHDDGIFAITIETQDSKAVAAAAQPNFDDEGRDGRNGRTIFDCDISISSSKVGAKELLRTITHELGHCIGLGHPHSNYHSIMSYSGISDSSELGLDDKAGITFLYPEEGIDQDVRYLTACGSVGGEGVTAGFVLVLPLLLSLFGWRRQ